MLANKCRNWHFSWVFVANIWSQENSTKTKRKASAVIAPVSVVVRTITEGTAHNRLEWKRTLKVSKFPIYNYDYPHQRARLQINDKITILENVTSCKRCNRAPRSKRAAVLNQWVVLVPFKSSKMIGMDFLWFSSHFFWSGNSSRAQIVANDISVRSIDIIARYRLLLFFDVDPNGYTALQIAAKNWIHSVSRLVGRWQATLIQHTFRCNDYVSLCKCTNLQRREESTI